jgi:serine/threonine protein kinase
MIVTAERLIEIFDEARACVADAEREKFLATACQGDAQLLQHVMELLSADKSAGDFLKPATLDPHFTCITEKPGDWIGHYKLLEKMGEGGCGVVYMAQQEQPVRRQVALKIIKLGMDTRRVVARFEAERQALALMEHSNIARVFDGRRNRNGTAPISSWNWCAGSRSPNTAMSTRCR